MLFSTIFLIPEIQMSLQKCFNINHITISFINFYYYRYQIWFKYDTFKKKIWAVCVYTKVLNYDNSYESEKRNGDKTFNHVTSVNE